MVSVFVALNLVYIARKCGASCVNFKIKYFFLILKTVLFFLKIIFNFKIACAHRACTHMPIYIHTRAQDVPQKLPRPYFEKIALHNVI